MLQVAPYNLGSAVLLIIAGFVDGAADWWLWGAAAALHVVLLEFGRYRSFPLSQAHFVERNAVVLIVALGESMVSLSLGLGEHALTAAVLLAAILSLALAASLWTLYFIDADDAAQHALEAAPSERVLRIAGLAFSYAFVLAARRHRHDLVGAHGGARTPARALADRRTPHSSRAARSSTSSASPRSANRSPPRAESSGSPLPRLLPRASAHSGSAVP